MRIVKDGGHMILLVLAFIFGGCTTAAPLPSGPAPAVTVALPPSNGMVSMDIPATCQRFMLYVEPTHPDRWDANKIVPGEILLSCFDPQGTDKLTRHRRDYPNEPVTGFALVSTKKAIARSPAAPPPVSSP